MAVTISPTVDGFDTIKLLETPVEGQSLALSPLT